MTQRVRRTWKRSTFRRHNGQRSDSNAAYRLYRDYKWAQEHPHRYKGSAEEQNRRIMAAEAKRERRTELVRARGL